MVIFFASCSSNKPAGSGIIRGGYSDKKIDDGIYEIVVEGVGGIWNSEKGMQKTWESRAGALCADSEYDLISVSNSSRVESGIGLTFLGGAALPYQENISIPVKKGYVRCKNSVHTLIEAKDILDSKYLVVKDRKVSRVPNNCPLSKTEPKEKINSSANAYFENKQYELAFSCFYQSASYGYKISDGNSEAQYKVGFMFEHGLGVEKDIDRAKQWYRKAVLNGSPTASDKLNQLNNESP